MHNDSRCVNIHNTTHSKCYVHSASECHCHRIHRPLSLSISGFVFVPFMFPRRLENLRKMIVLSTNAATLPESWTLLTIERVFSATELASHLGLSLSLDDPSLLRLRVAMSWRTSFLRLIVRLSTEQVYVLTCCLMGCGDLACTL